MWKNCLKSNARGMSLVEVMVVVTIMSLIGLGTATLMKNVLSIQRRSSIKTTMQEVKRNLEATLQNNDAWGNSVVSPANVGKLDCLRDDNLLGCPDGQIYQDFQVRDSANNIYYRGNNTSAGFTFDGAECIAFTVGGNDACPFRYDLEWEVECPGSSNPCRKPQVIIRGRLAYAPEDRSEIQHRIDVSLYDIDIRRGERMRYEPFELTMRVTDNSGGGNCTANAWDHRRLNTLEYDAGNNVTLLPDNFRFRLQPGRYECRVTAQGFEAVDGFKIRLRDFTNGVNYVVGGGFSGINSTATVTGSVSFDLATAAVFRLQHYCGTNSPSSVFDMGIPSQNYAAGSVFSSVSCVRSG